MLKSGPGRKLLPFHLIIYTSRSLQAAKTYKGVPLDFMDLPNLPTNGFNLFI